MERCSKELYKLEGFLRKEDGAKKLLKEKKTLFQARPPSLREVKQGSNHADYLIFFWALKRANEIASSVLIRKFLINY